MSGAPSKDFRLARRAQSPPSSASASGHQLSDAMQPTITICHGGDHRMRQSITIKSKVVRTTAFSREGAKGAVETVTTYEDSRTGVRQLSVGRHIGDRSHLSEKSRNEYTGEEEKHEELVNIPYEELGGFDNEWKKRMAQS